MLLRLGKSNCVLFHPRDLKRRLVEHAATSEFTDEVIRRVQRKLEVWSAL